MQFLSHISHIEVLNSHMWLVGIVLESADIEHFHNCRKFCWTPLLQLQFLFNSPLLLVYLLNINVFQPSFSSTLTALVIIRMASKSICSSDLFPCDSDPCSLLSPDYLHLDIDNSLSMSQSELLLIQVILGQSELWRLELSVRDGKLFSRSQFCSRQISKSKLFKGGLNAFRQRRSCQ